jgi:hypothetical protein
MKSIPETPSAVVIRTDFADTPAWQQLCAAISAPHSAYGFKANVEYFDDQSYAGITAETVRPLLPKNSNRTFIFLVDSIAISDPEHPILVVDLETEAVRTFRVIPGEMWAIENNLSLMNMIFEEFAIAVDDDGVFRGFQCQPE